MKKLSNGKQKIELDNIDAFRVRIHDNKVMVVMTGEQYEDFIDQEKMIRKWEMRLETIQNRVETFEIEYERLKRTCRPEFKN